MQVSEELGTIILSIAQRYVGYLKATLFNMKNCIFLKNFKNHEAIKYKVQKFQLNHEQKKCSFPILLAYIIKSLHS